MCPNFSSAMWAVLFALTTPVLAAGQDPRPHIVLVLVDDWGWNNAGYHRPADDPEIQTPNIDRLVREGVELDRHYVYMWCAPSRASLQSGRLPVHVHFTSEPASSVNPADPVSGFSGIPRNMTGIAEVLRRSGYRTHATGKWDAGFATWDHTPMGRGYETFFGYFHHSNDYWTQQAASSGPTACGSDKQTVDLVDLWSTSGPARGLNGTAYEEELFNKNSLDVIDRHDVSEPLFLFHAFHQIHTPLQVPTAWEQNFSFIENPQRRRYAAMVAYMDASVGKIVERLEAKNMWSNTLFVAMSDNGGATYYLPNPGDDGFGAASNTPLRGGKFSDWEGGVRVNAFVSGGAVPVGKRGSVLTDYVHLADWYATFASIAGADPTDGRAAAAGLPPIDGIDHSALLVGSAAPGEGNRTEIHQSARALVQGRWKLITGGAEGFSPGHEMGIPLVPGSSWDEGYGVLRGLRNDFSFKYCGRGCLFDIFADPSERSNVASKNRAVVKDMRARLDELNKGVFLPDRGDIDPQACSAWDGFYGPWIDVPKDIVSGTVHKVMV